MTAPQPSLLIIDDDDVFGRVLSRSLARHGYSVQVARDESEAMQMARSEEPEYIILDLNLNGASGLALIEPLLQLSSHARILVLTGYASISTAVHAIKLGAYQYLAKPTDAASILNALGDETSTETDLPTSEDRMSVARLEWEYIQQVLAEHDGNITATAKALNMHRRTLQRKLAKRPPHQ